jgi:regulator of cell morphogenesis and NO signaling
MNQSLAGPSTGMQGVPVREPLAVRTLGDLATHLSGATVVFGRYKLNYFCDGDVSLAEAAAAGDVALADLVAELIALKDERPDAISIPALIDHIEVRFHAVHRSELPDLVRLAEQVEAVHSRHPSVPTGLADMLDIVGQELITHMEQEEQSLFPAMREGDNSTMGQSIAVMRADHYGHGQQIRRLEALAHDFTPPDDACDAWRALYAGGRKLVNDLMEHIHTENNILFPRFA